MSVSTSQLGNPHVAAGHAYRSVQLAPNHYMPHLEYAKCLALVPGARQQAWQEGIRAVQLGPNEPDTHILMADLAYPDTPYPDPEGLRTAEAALQQALRLDPQNSRAMNDLARVRLARSQSLKALSGFSDALSADPNSDVALRNIGVVFGNWLQPAHWITLLATYVSLVALTSHTTPGRIVAGVVGLGVVGLLVGLVVRLRRVVPGRVALFLRDFGRRNRWSAAWGWCLVLSVFCLVLAPILPGDASLAPMGIGFLAIHIGVVLSWISAARRR